MVVFDSQPSSVPSAHIGGIYGSPVYTSVRLQISDPDPGLPDPCHVLEPLIHHINSPILQYARNGYVPQQPS
ncbi:hypothetical protein Syun_024779 [Stephania yunnanensis]|uniref:Uncharacterized protein n=1 Tax=Stephania yunnanensis TaxID=152371 RepID=A0AAP0EZ86_9MAGN